MSLELSQYYMWKTAIGLISVDGPFHHPEKQWVAGQLQDAPLPREQKNKLQVFLFSNPTGYRESFRKVVVANDRKKLLSLARIIFSLNNGLSEREKNAYKELKKIHREMSNGLDDTSQIQSSSRYEIIADIAEIVMDDLPWYQHSWFDLLMWWDGD